MPRQPPEDFATLVSRSITALPYRFQVRLRVEGSMPDVRGRIPAWMGVLEPLDEGHCVLTAGGDTYETVAALIVQTGMEFTLLEPLELAQPIRQIAARLLQGIAAAPCPDNTVQSHHAELSANT